MCAWCDYRAANAGRASDEELDAEYEQIFRARIRGLVNDGRWFVMSVEGWPPFAYTIGLWSRGHPELCVFGIEHHQACALLNEIAQRVVDGARVDDGDEFECNHGLPLTAFRLPDPGQVVLRANWFYRRKPRNSVPALQLVHPDVHGTWPWEPDCHQFPGAQPMPGTFDARADPNYE